MLASNSMTTDAWGVDDQYLDALGQRRETQAATRSAIHRAMGVDPGAVAAAPPVRVVLQAAQRIDERGEIDFEHGGSLRIDGRLPSDIPLGYHRLRRDDGSAIRLIVSPGRCYLPVDLKIWGWAVQLYAARSRLSWGIGDLGDLRLLGRWARTQGAGISIVNPLCAAAPGLPQQSSPYYPSSRRFRNPLYLRIEDVPGFGDLAGDMRPLAAAAHLLNAEPLIDRQQVYKLKMAALDQLWQAFGGDARFDDYCREQGEALRQFAAYSLLAESFGQSWRGWPVQYRRSDDPAVQQFSDAHAQRFRFFQWLQWLLDEQLARAAADLPVMQDLPIGANPDGADAWAWQDVLAAQTAIGAPPDIFNTLGQNWGLPPLVPHKLQAAGYQPFIDIVRAALRHAGGLRIDHILGFFRSFWIPDGFHAEHGAYVRYPVADMLAILALESVRAQAFVVGEDLGTVEEGVAESLARHDILSYAVVWFEDRPPAAYPRKALAAVTTHDLPTVAGLWSGSDLVEQQSLALEPSVAGDAHMRERLRKAAAVSAQASVDEVIEGVHRGLAAARSMVLAPTLDDALAVPERPNMPNTTGVQRPNWSLALPVPIEQLPEVERAAHIARILSAR
jgi:4-alpha-glucanotransferase